MGTIKSALELALERTKDIKGDKEGLEAKEYREAGMKLASKAEQDNTLNLKVELERYQGKQLAWVREGLRQVLASYLNLPSGKESLSRFANMQAVFVATAREPDTMEGYLSELSQFFAQYLQQREQLIQTIQKQLEPTLRQKEDAMSKQTGRRVRLTIENDPECAKFLSVNLDKLVGQYTQALDKIKEEVMELLA